MISLVGYTGFVGSNIYEGAKGKIERTYNSKNIDEAYGENPDLLIYAGLRAEKYLANNAPEKDKALICQAEDNIKKIDPKKLVLISTIDVFKNPVDVNETSKIDIENLHPYGYNRYQLELWVREKYPDALIIRLPGLFGKNIKKNFIYDYINVFPFMLKENKYHELVSEDSEIQKYYKLQDNGFYKADFKESERELLKAKFKKLGFTALNFTDSRSVYQFYDLSRLWDDIQIAINNDIRLWHPATEPVSASDVYYKLEGNEFNNELDAAPAFYDYRTVYAELFGGYNGYICDKYTVLNQISSFVEKYTR